MISFHEREAETSSNDLHLLWVIGHWIDKDRKLQRALLSLQPLLGGYGETDLCPALQKVIDLYEIGDHLGAFQMDNAYNNDTCLAALEQLYRIDVAEQRMRRFGHVVNLVTKALLFDDGLSKLQKQLSESNDDEAFKLWRKQGAIGKLHNVVQYVTRSGKRTLVFNAIQQEVVNDLIVWCLKLRKDTGVRWNSIYTMIQRALRLKTAITLNCARWMKGRDELYNLNADEPDAQDWGELWHYEDLLHLRWPWHIHLNLEPDEQLAAADSPPTRPAHPSTTSAAADDETDDEEYKAAIGSYNAPQAAERQRKQERKAELERFMKMDIDLDTQRYELRPLQWWIDVGELLFPT
ncbi:hypothetical protein KC316_g303 [Hortaea werneckii]|nr:hypothetical protein KC324_g344 [Hortaea werneckii]KAI7595781.1 hypothetical protein KC316_g303 [Hortaea werneckii]